MIEKEEKNYQKKFLRKSLLVFLKKSTYQAIYNKIFSYFIMTIVLYILNLYIEGKSFPFNFCVEEYFKDYIK